MSIKDLQNKKIAVIGLGVEGMSTVSYLVKQGIIPTVLDETLTEDNEAIKSLKAAGIGYIVGRDSIASLQNDKYDIVFRSPGISPLRKELVDAKERGALITSHTQLFFDLCPCPIIGVTGTKGKGTTATLIYEMLKQQEFDAYLGGNIGLPPLEFLDNLSAQSKVVLELSSFQLQDLQKSPHIAVVLMITSEHLDYHKDISEYVDAKRNILRFQTSKDFAIINRDYPASLESDILTEGKVFYVSRERETENACFALGGKIIVRRNGQNEEIIDTSDIALLGKHNFENACSAVLAAKLAGVSTKYIVSVLKTFTGLEHRLQFVREVNGVKYYDDSFSTTPETAIAAIEAFTQSEILILGGSSKKADFTELGKVIRLAKNIKAIIGIGVEWDEIKYQISNIKSQILFIEGAENMYQVVQAASKIAQAGDVVLLSPACASFGMFKNYKDRGEQFIREVNSL